MQDSRQLIVIMACHQERQSSGDIEVTGLLLPVMEENNQGQLEHICP